MTVIGTGKEATTHFTVLEHIGNHYTLVQCELVTGRTHQIRVHMQYIGYPLVGDPKYGQKKTIDFGGQVLHAETLGLNHPITGEYMEWTSSLPADYEQLLTELRES